MGAGAAISGTRRMVFCEVCAELVRDFTAARAKSSSEENCSSWAVLNESLRESVGVAPAADCSQCGWCADLTAV